ncbi:glycosyltransferase [Kitasatospora sp. HPMI-4]|uniref:glycosyltransferase n=1 Tax=Kitasatospora sp. HPMI-4 TaxID=3448443 RepID=UPI003F1AE046
MRILIATAGSQGDVAPFTGLGARLRECGHEVALATHARFADAAHSAGLGFHPLPVDPRSELASARGQRLLRASTGPRAMAELLRMGRRFTPALGRSIAEAADRAGPDLLLLSMVTAPLGQIVAEALDLPSVGLSLQPIHPTGEFASPLLGGDRSLGRLGNRLSAHGAHLALDRLYAPAVRDLRRRLGLPRQRAGALRRAHTRAGWPVLHGFSPSVVPRPADWGPELAVTGYWWPHLSADWQPPAELADFLRAGPAPVCIGFGSLVVADAGRLGQVVSDALRIARLRAVVQAGWTGLRVTGDDVLTVQEVPHQWLFPQAAAVVHHAGAGTTAAGLRAGVPQIPVPGQLDAPFWAARLTRLGVSPRPLPLAGLTADRLAAALREAVDDPRYRLRARRLAARIDAEDGAGAVRDLLARLTGG